jgi:hypothetical protein
VLSDHIKSLDVRKLRERLRAAWDYELENHPFASGDFENPYGADEPSFDELIQPRLPEFDSANERPLRYADRLFAGA